MHKNITYKIVYDRDLTKEQELDLQQLFDAEYLTDYGKWTRHEPYGYSSFDLRILAYTKDQLIGHVAAQRRLIQVGKQHIFIAGIGGMLVDANYRNQGIARHLLTYLRNTLSTHLQVDFGYLGCREEIVPFYERCQFQRIVATEYLIDRISRMEVPNTTIPIMICAGLQPVEAFPIGDIHLNGPAW